MTVSTSIRMIPRNHWEYSLVDIWKTAFAAKQPGRSQASSFGGLFPGPFYFTTSGRLSLYTILCSLKLPAGAHVGVPLFCCSVVFDAILQAGCTPEFIDITDDTYTISPSHLRKKRDKLSAVIAVHMFGHPADMDAVMEAAGNIPVIEDCAHALFSTYKGRLAGTMGAASFFSFRSGKYVSAGEGSAILCNRSDLSGDIGEMVDSYPEWRFHQSALHTLATYIKTAMYNRPWYGTVGQPVGSRLDKSLNLTAKSGFTMRKIAPGDFRIMNDRLHLLRPKIEKQRDYAFHLMGALQLKDAVFPHEKSGCKSNYYQFAIRVGDQDRRDRLVAHLLESGIDAAKYLDGIARESATLYGYAGDCPVAERCSSTVMTVPAYYSLSQDDLTRLVDSINGFQDGKPGS